MYLVNRSIWFDRFVFFGLSVNSTPIMNIIFRFIFFNYTSEDIDKKLYNKRNMPDPPRWAVG